MKWKKGMSLITLGLMTILIIIQAGIIVMLLFTALKRNVNNIEQMPPYIDELMWI